MIFFTDIRKSDIIKYDLLKKTENDILLLSRFFRFRDFRYHTLQAIITLVLLKIGI